MRTIRLKEHQGDLSEEIHPSPGIVEIADETIPDGPYLKRTDSHGFIITGNEVPDTAPPMLVLGDSFVESMYAAEESRFTSIVERKLLSANNPYRVLNGGYSGTTSLHMLNVLTTKAPTFLQPGAKLLLTIGQSDTNALLVPGLYWDGSRSVSPFQPPHAARGISPADWRDVLKQMITALIQVSRTLGFDVALTTGMYRNGDFSFDPVLRATHRRSREIYERHIEVRRAIPATAKEVAREHGVPYFDANALLVDRPELFYDALHLNTDGQNFFADHLYRWITNEWIPSQRF